PMVTWPCARPPAAPRPPAAGTAATPALSSMAAAISSAGSATRVKASVPCQWATVRWCHPNPCPVLKASLNAAKPSPIEENMVAAASTSAPPGPWQMAAATASGRVNVRVAGSYSRYPPAAWARSHSRTSDGSTLTFAATSAVVSGPAPASAAHSPLRVPSEVSSTPSAAWDHDAERSVLSRRRLLGWAADENLLVHAYH